MTISSDRGHRSEIAVDANRPEGIYPAGDRFGVGAYSAEGQDLSKLAQGGFGLVQTYSTQIPQDAWARRAATAGMSSLMHVDEQQDAASTEALISRLAAAARSGWWDLPEELRWWLPDELRKLTTLSTQVRRMDPLKRPVFMYIPGHYDQSGVQRYVPHLDIIGTGAYADAHGKPRAWIRWRIESQLRAIEAAGFSQRQKTAIAILGTYSTGKAGTKDPTATGVVHDAFASIAAGARAVLFYSYERARRLADSAVLGSMHVLADLIGGEGGVGEWVLHGETVPDVAAEVTVGPRETPEFIPAERERPIVYLSVRAAAWDRAGARLVIVVNSAEQPVTATIRGLPAVASGAVRLRVRTTGTPSIEEGAITIGQGALVDELDASAVHLYWMPIVQGR